MDSPDPPQSHNDPPPTPLTAAGYDDAVRAILAPTQELRNENERLKRALRWTICGVVIALVGLLVAAVSILRGYQDRDRIARNAHLSRVAQCATVNNFKQADYQSWQFVIALSAGGSPNETPAQRQQANVNTQKFVAFKKRQDAPTDCSKIR